jgi:hypothetical protein
MTAVNGLEIGALPPPFRLLVIFFIERAIETPL